MENREINTTRTPEKVNNYVVGIGASAGGLEAVQTLLASLPANTGFPFILVQHLSPDYKSLLCEILSRHTTMPVIQVEDGMPVEPNHVYVIQPGKNMIIENGKLLLSAQKERELNLPIDMFFRSLAKEAGSHAIAIVLSGTGSDGSNGLKSIKENDGMALVQDYETAKFDGMPKNAMRTGIVDAQMPPNMIAAEIAHIASANQENEQLARAVEEEINEELLKKVYVILKKVCDVNFSHYKRATILRRLERRKMLTHKDTLSDYVELLYQSPEEVKTLSKEVLIGVTSFFRDPEYFQILKDKVVRDIVVNGSPDEPIRVWIAGCSTGEEAYSIGILFCEEMEALKVKRIIKIFATDLDSDSINIAGKGVYSDNIVDSVSVTRLSKYFTFSNNTYTVKRDLRKMIIFSTHNVFQDPPFGRLDLLSCRNMMIYFQPSLQNDLFNIFHIVLKDKGFLFLGKSEAVGAFTDAFPVVDAVAKIFTHTAGIKFAGSKSIPFLQTTYNLDDDFMEDLSEHITRKPLAIENAARASDQIDSSVLEQFLPGCIVVNERNEVIHTYGACENYVHISLGKFSNHLYDILTEALKVPVSTILKEAREKKQKVQYKDICFAGEQRNETIILTAVPVGLRAEQEAGLYAVVFSTNTLYGISDDAIPYEIDSVASQRITDLEQYLQETQEKLIRSVAEQDCVNEELQSTNEELLTANEELQSSNEELQSVNEELYTVNAEYQQKLTELSNLNDDIANFLSCTLIGIIFVDNSLNIRRFTDYVSSEFNVMSQDIGRSIKSISYHFPTVDFPGICTKVLRFLTPDDREVTSNQGKSFLMRIAPYRSTEHTILGCVITLVDITQQKLGLAKLQNVEEQLDALQKTHTEKSRKASGAATELTAAIDVVAEKVAAARQSTEGSVRSDKLNEIALALAQLKTLAASISGMISE